MKRGTNPRQLLRSFPKKSTGPGEVDYLEPRVNSIHFLGTGCLIFAHISANLNSL